MSLGSIYRSIHFMRLSRVFRAVVISGLCTLLVAFSWVQGEQHLLRYRAERLLSDFQAIHLHQSKWVDAQALMTRWGAWGHYDGQCTASDCTYTIMLADPTSSIGNHIRSETGWQLLRLGVRLYELLGGKPGWFWVRFVVQDGAIWRSSVGILLDVPPSKDDRGYGLSLLARSSDSLHREGHGRVLGADDQLADHPNYKEGRPDGCEGCLDAEVTFTPYISSAELKQVTSYDLSCFTRFRYCLNLPDVLPISRSWHLYPNTEPAYVEPKSPTVPMACAIPVYVRSRDADSMMLVDVISSTSEVEARRRPSRPSIHSDS